MSDTPSSAPVKAWLIALLVVLPMLLPLVAPFPFVEPAGLRGANEYHYREDLTRLFAQEKAERSAPLGVMLAMSGGNCATVGPLQLAGDGVHMYVAFYPDATAETFAGLIDLLVAGEPDFVVIQDTILVLDRPARRFEYASARYEEARSYWTGQLFGLARKLGVDFVDQDSSDESWRCPAIAKQKLMWEEAVQATMRRIDSYSQQRRAESVEFLQKFAAANIPVLIVSPPANNYTVGYGLAVHDAAAELATVGVQNASISLHRQVALTPTEQFNDPMHLSADASQSYRLWLNGEIKRVLRQRHDE